MCAEAALQECSQVCPCTHAPNPTECQNGELWQPYLPQEQLGPPIRFYLPPQFLLSACSIHPERASRCALFPRTATVMSTCVHCMQDAMAAVLQEELGPLLYVPPPGYIEGQQGWLSPETLKGKVLIRAKVGVRESESND